MAKKKLPIVNQSSQSGKEGLPIARKSSQSDEAISEDLSTPQEQPTKPSVESGREFELPTQPKPLESEATSVSPIATPEQIQEGEAILDMQADFFNERRGEDSQKIYTEFLQATNPEKLNYIEQKLDAGDLTEEDKYRFNQEAVSFKMSAIKRNIDRIENQYSTNPDSITDDVKSEFKGYVEDLVKSVDEAKGVIRKYPEYHKEILDKQAAQANKDARYNYYKALFPQAILPATIAEKSAQTLGKFATDILSIPRTLSFNSDYGWTDALAEKTSNFIDDAIQNVNAMSPTQQQGEILETIEDEDGNTTTKINPDALLGQSVGVVTEMIPMFVMAGGVTKGLTKLGTATNKASKVGMFSSVMAQTHNNAYEEAIANGASQAEASVAAISTSAAIGAVNLLNPMEKVYSSSKGAKDYVRGLLTGKDKAQNFKDFLRTANFEGLEETIEVPTQAAVNYAMNATMNTNLPTDVSSKEMLSSYVLGSIGGFTYAPLNKSKTPNTRQSLHWSIENQKDFYEGLSSLKGQSVMIDGNEVEITDDFVDKYKKQHEAVAKRVKSIRSISPKGDFTEDEKVRLSELVKEKYSVEQYMKEDVDDLVKDKLKQDISDINDEINSIINQETSETSETKEDEITTEGDGAESTQEENQTAETEIAGADRVQAALDMPVKDKKTLSQRFSDLYSRLNVALVDRSRNVKRVLDKAGLSNVTNRLVSAMGYGGVAKAEFEKAYNDIYKGMPSKKRSKLDDIIQVRRVIAIEENRKKRGLGPIKHPNDMTLEDAKEWIEREKQSNPELFNEVNEKADKYFDVFRGYLNKAKESGFISQELYDEMVEIDYQPRKFVQHLLDAEGQGLDAQKMGRLANEFGMSKPIIRALKEGSNMKLIKDSEFLLQSYINGVEKRIFQNNAAKELKSEMPKAIERLNELESKKKITRAEKSDMKWLKRAKESFIIPKVIGKSKSGALKYKMENENTHTPIYYFEDGVKKPILVKNDLYEEWFGNQKLLNPRLKSAISLMSGSKLLKAMATGINPLFVLTNTPRDFGHIIMFTDNYSDILPISAAQLSSDFISAIIKIKSNSKTYQEFVQYGGMMDFLYSQGSMDEKGSLPKMISSLTTGKVKDFTKGLGEALTSLNMYSEVGFRVAVFSRVLNKGMKEIESTQYESIEEKQKAIEDLKYRAARKAREIIDFNQGGSVTRDAESVLPYINAAVQGARVATEYFQKEPHKAIFKAAQSAMFLSAGVASFSMVLISALRDDEDEEAEENMSAKDIYLETMRAVSPYQRRAYIIIPTGKKNEQGDWGYIKIAKTQQIRPISTLSDFYVENALRGMSGREQIESDYIMEQVSSSFFGDYLPFDPRPKEVATIMSRNPLLGGGLEAMSGYDFFRDKPIHYEVDKVVSSKEGYSDPNMPEIYKFLSDEFELSPARTKHYFEKFTTSASTNPYMATLYATSNAMLSDDVFTDEIKEQAKNTWNMVSRKFYDHTSEYYIGARAEREFKELLNDEQRTQYDQNTAIKEFARSKKDEFIDGKDVGQDIVDFVKENFPKEKQKSVADRVKRYIETPSTAYGKLNIYYERDPLVKAILFYKEYGAIEGDDLSSAFKELKQKPSKAFRLEYDRIKKVAKERAKENKGQDE